MRTVHDVSYDECARLLGAATSGRVAVSTQTGPHIVPVEHSLHGASVLFRAAPHSLVVTYGRGAVLCFEASRLDAGREGGWSVAVRGRAEIIDDAEELDRVEHAVPSAWSPEQRTLVVRIPWTEVTGRTFGRTWEPVA